MAGQDNIAGQGFHTNPERINKTGANKGSKWLSTLLREKLEEGDNAARLINKLLELANDKGDLNAIREVIDRLEGKAKQEITTEFIDKRKEVGDLFPLDETDNQP